MVPAALLRIPLRAVNAAKVSARGAATVTKHPVTGSTPPTLDEFDPLNPGEWQLGAGGKILPRLQEGTRCGKLVMGKYGLYSPKIRDLQERFNAGLDAGKKSEDATAFNHKMTIIAKILAHFALLMGFWNLAVLVFGPIWPRADLKPVGSS
ncbi:Protein Y67H2A.5 [Aphelenchoides avenae]|nr:Protein Y67H2A.5 [Aphelenchus avenae]KAH7730366.1 Protein Y67H2A.5 [Aphelenchus avenae]